MSDNYEGQEQYDNQVQDQVQESHADQQQQVDNQTNDQTNVQDNNQQEEPKPAVGDREQHKIFIGGLSWDTTEEGMRAYFGKYGDIVDCVVMKDPQTQRSRGFGFVSFSDGSALEAAIAGVPHTLDSRTVEVKKAQPKGEKRGEFKTKKVFIGGIAQTTSEDTIKAYFTTYGPIEELLMMKDRATERPRGFGFITFESEDVVENLCQKRWHDIDGKQVEVKKAEPRGMERGGPRGYNDGPSNHYGGYGGRYASTTIMEGAAAMVDMVAVTVAVTNREATAEDMEDPRVVMEVARAMVVPRVDTVEMVAMVNRVAATRQEEDMVDLLATTAAREDMVRTVAMDLEAMALTVVRVDLVDTATRLPLAVTANREAMDNKEIAMVVDMTSLTITTEAMAWASTVSSPDLAMVPLEVHRVLVPAVVRLVTAEISVLTTLTAVK
eukprot:Ihof_evm4s236 gene=Ihof_evmTU4s236